MDDGFRHSQVDIFCELRYDFGSCGIINWFDLGNHSPLKPGSQVAFHGRVSVRREACGERKFSTLLRHLIINMIKLFLGLWGLGKTFYIIHEKKINIQKLLQGLLGFGGWVTP